jgi:hypothetical protein
MALDSLTIGEARELAAMMSGGAQCAEVSPYKVGAAYLIRTVTHIYTGRVVRVGRHELVLTEAAWIADTGRFADALKDLSKLNEVEPFPDGEVVVGRGAIVDACVVTCELPRQQK